VVVVVVVSCATDVSGAVGKFYAQFNNISVLNREIPTVQFIKKAIVSLHSYVPVKWGFRKSVMFTQERLHLERFLTAAGRKILKFCSFILLIKGVLCLM